MKQTIHCYANWHFDIIVLIAAVGLVLTCNEGGTVLINITGAALLFAGFLIAKKWHRQGKLQQIDQITE